MTLLIFYVALAIGISFLCSILEAVLLSITPSYVTSLEESRPRLAKRLQSMKDDIDRPLAAILSLNTIAHTVGAAGAGAQAAYVFGDAAVGIFSGVLTLLILVLSEIIPKTLGATYWQGLTPFAARAMPMLIWSMWPLVKLSQFITRLLARGGGQYEVSREEIAAMADIGRREGVIDAGQSRIVANLLRFDSLRVEDIMTPRTVAFALEQTMTVGEFVAQIDDVPFSRIPVYDEEIDNVTGFVLKDDVLAQAVKDKDDVKLADLERELVHVNEDHPLDTVFETLLTNNRHIALVVDKFGGTAGIVTIEDLVETLIGMEIVDEADTTADLQELARENWEKRRAALEGRKPAIARSGKSMHAQSD